MNQPNLSTLLRVLLVEDSLPVRHRLRSLIEESGPIEIVGEAGAVVTALQLFHSLQPDAVVLDLGLADGDGGGVLAEIKHLRPACVVIMLSSIAIPECREFCLRLGADHFFDKSWEFERVPEVLLALGRAQRASGNSVDSTSP